MNRNIEADLQAERTRLDKNYGFKTGALASQEYKLNVVPTGILALDYALGTGGWPLGHPVEVFGPPDIGKSSVLGFNAIKQAQKEGKTCGIIALEPSFDKEWAIKNGIDPELVIIARPDTGEDAFAILHDWVTGDIIDFILFDSVGAVLREKEQDTNGKANVGGQSSLITWGIKRILVPAWKNNKGVILLNQVRDNMNSRIPGLVDSPGGWALKHSCPIRVELKPGRDRYTERSGTGKDAHDVIVGRQIVAIVQRNKLSEGTQHRARFDFYQKEVEDHPLGVDATADLLATATRTNVIEKAGAWYRHEVFPEGQLNGKKAVDEFVKENPEVVDDLRKQVLDVMLSQGALQDIAPPEDSDA